ncbi:MAG: glycosyltransferase family 39 protein [Anaerolineales bacterium]
MTSTESTTPLFASQTWHTRLETLRAKTWLAYLAALAAGLLYGLQSWIYLHTLDSVLDEGAYLYKGYAFVTGQYQIYQDYGFWSNHMPLSFYIPGVVQAVFGPGLIVGRYFSLLLGMVMLLGVWLLVRRLGGYWWAAAVLWGITVNPAVIKMYSTAVTQVLIACMLVWVLALTLGGDRPRWQLALGAVLAGVMWMTRINFFPVLPLLVLYIFWEYGRRTGLIAALAGGLTVLLLHVFFWPEILRMYAFWLPDGLFPFLSPWEPPAGTHYWNPRVSLTARVSSLFRTFRFHFLTLMSACAAWILWPKRADWKSRTQFRQAVFLTVLLLVLWSLHFWATMSKNYCAFCLEGYTAFFMILGWLLLVLVLVQKASPIRSRWRDLITAALILVVVVGIGFTMFEDLGLELLELRLPFISLDGGPSLTLLPDLSKILDNKFSIDKRTSRFLIPSAFALILALCILGVSLLALIWQRRKSSRPASFASWALLITLVLGVLLSPTRLLGQVYTTFDCGGDIPAAYTQVGEYLASVIPPGSQVYWKGGLSVAPLLYVPGIQIYPSQVNGDYSYFTDGDPNALQKYGFWNRELAEKWLVEADFILIEDRYFEDWFQSWVNLDDYIELPASPDKNICRDNSKIRIFTPRR